MKPAAQTVTIHIPLTFITRGGRKTILSQINCVAATEMGSSHDAIALALARAFRWKLRLENGRYSSVADLARGEKQKVSHIYNLLRLTLLAPQIIEGILSGNLSLSMRAVPRLLSMPWNDQCCTIQARTD